MSKIKAGTTSTTAYQVEADTTGTLVLQTGASPTTAVTIGSDQSTTLAGTLNLASQNMTPYTGFKNRIINGAMMISQRGTTFSGLTDGNNGTYTVDRWAWGETGTSTGVQTVSQDTSAPTGFINSLKVQTTTAHSVGTGNWYNAYQWLEGLNCADLAWGTASAASVTLSFWVRSSLTGTFAGVLQNSAFDTSYVFNYTISVADTWEQKTITVAGPTSGTWLTTNGRGIRIAFDLGAGSTYQTTANTWASGNYGSSSGAVSVVGTLNATFYITGVQLEKGSTATSFDSREYGDELRRCQRYYYKMAEQTVGSGCVFGSNNYYTNVFFPVAMRAAPTFSASAQNILLCFSNSNGYASSVINGGTMSTYGADIQATATGAIGAGAFIRLSSGYLQFSSEL